MQVCYYTIVMNEKQIYIPVFRDGQIDQEFEAQRIAAERRERLQAMGEGTIHAIRIVGSGLAQAIGKPLSEAITNVDLTLFDNKHGTHLQREWHEQRRATATLAMREKAGL